MAGMAVLRRGRQWRTWAFAIAAVVSALHANVAFGPLFGDGAVLQRDKPVAVWGSAEPRETVVVTFAGQTVDATTSADGEWMVYLAPMPASDVGAELTARGTKTTAVAHDVVVGEVWLCSGQSNMEFTVDRAANAAHEIAAAHYPLLREIRIGRQVSEEPTRGVPTSGWKPALPSSVGGFSAVAYFFAREVHEKTGIPVGIVNASVGGTPIESWMSLMALASEPGFQVVAERWKENVAQYPTAKADYDRQQALWTAAEVAAKAKGEKTLLAWRRQYPAPRPPREPGGTWTPTGLFNGMINPLLPYGVRGILWYQGESNTNRPGEYQHLFAAMIRAWRAHFGQGDMPFYWVNLAGFRPAQDATDMSYAWLREAQTKTLALPNTGQALAIDLGDPDDIHPTNKQEVGRRLALLAKCRVYGVVADDTGPLFASATREGTAMLVRFTNVSDGLIAHDKPPQALELAGADRVFHPAVGRIEHGMLLVSSLAVKEPVAVRYAWRNAPDANLYNGSGLPATPFRSDDW